MFILVCRVDSHLGPLSQSYNVLDYLRFYFCDKKEGKKHSEVIVVFLIEQVKEVGSGENVMEMRTDVSKGWTIQEKVFFIFGSLNISKEAYSFIPMNLGNRPTPSFTLELMRISFNPCNMHSLLSIG